MRALQEPVADLADDAAGHGAQQAPLDVFRAAAGSKRLKRRSVLPQETYTPMAEARETSVGVELGRKPGSWVNRCEHQTQAHPAAPCVAIMP